MKKIAAALVALALLLSASGLAFRGQGYPAWDGMTVPPNYLSGAFGEDRLSLKFDPSDEYSNVMDRIIQACFFAYDAAETNYLELYLLIPQNILSGDHFKSGEGLNCTIDLYETSISEETFYSADGRDNDGSSYEIQLESVEFGESTITVSGKFAARLCRYEKDAPTQDFLDISEAHFNFTLPTSTGSARTEPQPEATFPALPGATQEPGATFPALPGATQEPSVTFPAFPDLPDATFPALPEDSDSPDSFFPGFQSEPRSGGAPAFTLPPDYAVI